MTKDMAGDGARGFVEYPREELDRIRKALDKQLGPEFISKRKGPGSNSVQYLEGWKAINLANNIFGPNGWCTELRNFQVDYIDERGGSVGMGISAIVRVSLKDGTYHEDIGYGSIDNCRTKSAAFDKCKKEAVTDGMKRALRQFGNALGNCLYDKDFLSKVTKVTQNPKQFDESNLMRVEEKVKVEKEAAIEKEEVPGNVPVGEGGHPDDEPAGEDPEDSFLFSDDWPEEISQNERKQHEQGDVDSKASKISNPQDHTPSTNTRDNSQVSTSSIPINVTFVAAKSAETILKDPSLQSALKYDPSHQSQTIPKSSFINHSTSAPVKKAVVIHRDENKENRLADTKRSMGLPPGKLPSKRLHK
ncbi:DEKNAAC100909 [Brettanomyces naardenensis]|uniref:DNA repair and recombination protein RAD52 n=1 Tax=Brettanomyces naardenensis TaxID=13370 RepID=A0A448YG30_BRENA|nr:DEKNAAC100909 [Brettanomyces naardenensis]